jgi:D-sedoheptulose 7-phosphate isomerase
MENLNLIEIIHKKIELDKSILSLNKEINLAIEKIYKILKNGGKVFLCGNGGSAADAQHIAAEFLVRLRPKINRKPFPVISLATDTSTITACANDYGYDYIFKRNLEALATNKDLLIAISTSGNSKNIIKVLKYAKKNKIFSIGFLGNKGGNAKKFCNLNLIVPSNNVARIQETHIFFGHFIFENVENLLINKKNYD